MHIKYLVHLLGDMHCPTHVYYYPDNMTLGKFPIKLHGVETNYHKIWDGQLLDSRHKFWGFQDYRHALDNYTDEEIARLCDIAMCGDHGIGSCFDARLDLPKAIAKGDDICALRYIKTDKK